MESITTGMWAVALGYTFAVLVLGAWALGSLRSSHRRDGPQRM